jgi:putative SOS response-associated peptidase YedK
MGGLAFAGRRVDPHLRDHHDAAERIVRRLHNRMPAVLSPEMWPAWLGEEPATVPDLKAMLASYPSEGMTCWPISSRVCNVKNNDPTLIEPIAAA